MIRTIDTIKEQLKSLSPTQALTFAYILCKRSFPDYALFSEYEDFGKPELIYSGIVALRKHIAGQSSPESLEELTLQLWEDGEVAPDTDDFPGNLSASLALNTVSMLYHSLEYAMAEELGSIERVAETALNSVEMYYVVSNNIDQTQPKEAYAEQVNKAVIVQAELLLQQSLIEKIQSVGADNTRIYTQIKTSDSRLAEHSLYANFVYA